MRWTVFLAMCMTLPPATLVVSGSPAAQDHEQTLQALLDDARVAQSRGISPRPPKRIEKLSHWSLLFQSYGRI